MVRLSSRPPEPHKGHWEDGEMSGRGWEGVESMRAVIIHKPQGKATKAGLHTVDRF